MISLVAQGGVMVWLLLLCGIVALGVFFERLVFFHRCAFNTSDWIIGVLVAIRSQKYEEALRSCATAPSPVSRVAEAIVSRHTLPWQELNDVAQQSAQLEIPKFKRYLSALTAVAVLSPLLGLLGAVGGLLHTFQTIHAQAGNATIIEVSGDVYRSLIVIAVSLVIAIPTFAAQSYLVARANSLIDEIESCSIQILIAIRDSLTK